MSLRIGLRRTHRLLSLACLVTLLGAWAVSLWRPLRLDKGGFKPRIVAGEIVCPLIGPHKKPSRPTNYGFILPNLTRARVVVQEDIDDAVVKSRQELRKRSYGEALEDLRLTRDQFGRRISNSPEYSFGYTDSGVLVLVDKNDWYLGEGVFDTNRIRFQDHVRFTTRVTAAEIPMWIPTILALIAAGYAWRFELSSFIRRFRTPAGHCRTCRYDLFGNTTGRCPECGTVMEQAKGIS